MRRSFRQLAALSGTPFFKLISRATHWLRSTGLDDNRNKRNKHERILLADGPDQGAGSLVFADPPWIEFSLTHFYAALREFTSSERHFGRLIDANKDYQSRLMIGLA